MENKDKKAEALEVKEPTEVKTVKNATVTQKTLKAMSEQLKRCVEDGLAEEREVRVLLTEIRSKWIEKNL